MTDSPKITGYGIKLTPQIERELPVLLEYIRIMHADYILPEIASKQLRLKVWRPGPRRICKG
jgi:hypothetical protein